MKKIILFALLSWQTLLVAQQDNYCRTTGEFTPSTTTNIGCTTAWQNYVPPSTIDTTVLNVVIVLENLNTDDTAYINRIEDSTLHHWIWNLNYIYGHIEQAVQNVGNTQYIPDTRIRFRLINIYRAKTDGIPPSTLNVVRINIYAGPDGNGDSNGGYARGFHINHPLNNTGHPYIEIFFGGK